MMSHLSGLSLPAVPSSALVIDPFAAILLPLSKECFLLLLFPLCSCLHDNFKESPVEQQVLQHLP